MKWGVQVNTVGGVSNLGGGHRKCKTDTGSHWVQWNISKDAVVVVQRTIREWHEMRGKRQAGTNSEMILWTMARGLDFILSVWWAAAKGVWAEVITDMHYILKDYTASFVNQSVPGVMCLARLLLIFISKCFI